MRNVPITPAVRRQVLQAASQVANQSKIQSFDCGIHDLVYRSFRAGCPMCETEREIRELRIAVKELTGKLAFATENTHKLQVQTDISTAIRDAAQLLDDADMSFLKTVLYQWRDEKSLALKVTHGSNIKKRRRKGEEIPANGFIVIPRSGDPYGHVCSSVGGMAIAGYFEEATNWVGPAQAMSMLTRGMAPYLPGAITR